MNPGRDEGYALQLLGRPALRSGPQALPLTARKGWALLLLLALQGALPRARLAAELWPALDETTGRRNLRRELARLAEVGAAGLVRAEGDLLHLADGVAVDVPGFERAAAAGRHDEALALWAGPLAEGLTLVDAAGFEQWLDGERERLRALWRDALEARARAAPPDEAEPLWRRLLQDDPLQERHHAALIGLLVAAGRREAAQEQFERCRGLLASELGLVPLDQTRALLDEVPPPTPPPAAPVAPRPALLPGALPFVGRQAEVAALERAWAGRRWVLVQGEGGVGKTRLVTDFCAAQGAWALVRCQAGDRGVPYASLVRALRLLGGGELPAGLPGWVREEVARVLPELGPAPRALASEEEQVRFFEACALAWSALVDEGFDALVLDDLQHADDSSLRLLAWLLPRGTPGARVFLLARPAERLQTLAESAGLHLPLQPLHDEPVLELVRQLSGSAQGQRFAARLQAATGGNPFFIAETLRLLAETGRLQADEQGRWHAPLDTPGDDYRGLPLPASVRDAVLARVQRLPEGARRVLDAASVAGEPLQPRLLAAACALSEAETDEALSQALEAALLRENDRGEIVFGHELAQQALASALTPQRARLLHRRLALAAEATGERAAVIAAHFERAGERQRAIPHRLHAGDEAMALQAGLAAVQEWRAALAAGPTPEQRAQLLPRLARALVEQGDEAGWRAALQEIDGLLGHSGLPPAARIEAILRCADIECEVDRSDLALARLDALLPGLPAGPGLARALRVRSMALQSLGRLEEAQAAAEQGLVTLGDAEPLERARLSDVLTLVLYHRGRSADALASARQAIALWTLQGDRRDLQRGHYRLGVLMTLAGQPEAGERELRVALQMAEEMHLVEAQRDVIANLMKLCADRGDGAAMLALAEHAWKLSPSFPRAQMRARLLHARLFAVTLLGRFGEALTLAEQLLAEAERSVEPTTRQHAVMGLLDLVIYFEDFGRARALLASLRDDRELGYMGKKLSMNRCYLELRAGDLAAARAALAEVGDPESMQQIQDRATWAVREAELRLAEGRAAEVLPLLAPWGDALPNVELRCMTWIARLQAWAALGRRADPEAQRDWAAAAEVLRQAQVPPMEAWELRCALVHASADAPSAEPLRAEAEAAGEALADSVAAWPAYRARFQERVRRALAPPAPAATMSHR